MSFANLHTVRGYWLGPPVWFASSHREPLSVPGVPGQDWAVYRRSLNKGGELAVSEAGVVLIDFSGLDRGEPAQAELESAPFSDDAKLATASVIASRRVELLNAHQLCLLAAMGVRESEEDIWSPDPRPVSVHTLWHEVDGSPAMPMNEAHEYGRFRDTPTVHRIMFAFQAKVIERSVQSFEQLLDVPRAPRACHGLLHAIDHYRHWQFDQALILAWTTCEAMLGVLWERYFTDSAKRAGLTLNHDHRKKLKSSEFSSSVILENLTLAGCVAQELYDELVKARGARNRWVHQLERVSQASVSSAIFAGVALVSRAVKVDLDVSLSLTPPSEPGPRVD